MPTFANIKVSVVSQYELVTLPEHILPDSAEDKFRRYSGPAALAPLPTPTSPFIAEPSTSPIITLYVPNTAGSRFWVDYAVSGPQNPNSLYYFDLSVNEKHVVSWGCGEKDGFGGKTMFKIFESTGKQALLGYGETAALMEDPMRDVDGLKMLDIKVCRAKGRSRVNGDEQGNEMFAVGTGCPTAGLGSTNLFDSGFAVQENTKSMYKYALLDPLDKPYVTFRYVYKSWNQLETLEVMELPDDQHIDVSLARLPSPAASPAAANSGFSFEDFINYDPFQPVPTTAHSTCSIFVPPTYEYYHLPIDRAQQPTYPGTPGTAQTARSSCSIFLPPPPTPPKSPRNSGLAPPVPTTPSLMVTPPSGQQSYILPVPHSAKVKNKGAKGRSSGNSSSPDGSPVGGTHIYDSSLPLRLSNSSSGSSSNDTSPTVTNNDNNNDGSQAPASPPPASPPPAQATDREIALQALIAEQELRIQRATEKGLAWLKTQFPADRVIPEPPPHLSRKEVGREMMRIIGRRTAGRGPQGHMMSQITRQTREAGRVGE